MKEYCFTELGYFTKSQIEKIKEAMQGKTYMKFEVEAGGYAGNCTLIIRTNYQATESAIKEMFLYSALAELAKMKEVE